LADREDLFHTEFNSRGELDEAISEVERADAARQEAVTEHTTMIDPNRLRQMGMTYGIMRYLLKGTNARLSYKLCEPIQSMGSVSVEGKDLEFCSSELFTKAAEFATNTEVYPLTSGDVRLTFTFHKLTVPVA
jgi:hypothetical protein